MIPTLGAARRTLSITLGLTLSACGAGGVCDKNASIDPSAKVGDCAGLDTARVLGNDKATCAGKTASCTSAADTDTLNAVLNCLEKLPACTAAAQASFVTQQTSCYARLPTLSEPCRTALFGTMIPGVDAGVDAGIPDAGRQPNDGGAAVELTVVADETTFALAWVTSQAGPVERWELNTIANRQRLPEQYLTPPSLRTLELVVADAGGRDAGPVFSVTRTFFLAGVNAAGDTVYGNPDASVAPVGDGGVAQCGSALDCPQDRVCDLSRCVIQSCQPGGATTCPNAYVCFPNGTCNRTGTVGQLDAGGGGGMSSRDALPFVSGATELSTGALAFSPQQPVGAFPGRAPRLVAINSAEQLVILEKEGQLLVHLTRRRGKDLPGDTLTSLLDTVGQRTRATYVAQSDTVFACYVVGRAVRVRRSLDHGLTWGTDAFDVQPPETDAGLATFVNDCDVAPWKNGEAMLLTSEDGALKVRTISNALAASAPVVAFFSAPPDGSGINIYNPQRPALATSPADDVVHVLFAASRTLAGGTVDLDVYGVSRDGSGTNFTPAIFVNATSVTQGNSFAQDFLSVVIEPGTKRAVAAFTATENAGGGFYSTVYTSLYYPALKKWLTGSDLSVFARRLTEYPVFPARTANVVWDAYGPSLAVQKNTGRIWLSVVAGPRNAMPTPAEYRMYLLGFDFDVISPTGGKGWYLAPARMMADTRVWDQRGNLSSPPPTQTSLAADGQLSIYGAFVEGVGAGQDPNRAVYVSQP